MLGRPPPHQPPDPRDQPVSSPARPQPGGLVSLGRRGAGQGQGGEHTDPPQHRLLGLPLVPRDGAGVVRGPEAIAALMNAHFVSIKVDREERPDLDDIYMAAIAGRSPASGGWPMTVFLTPDQQPVLRRDLLSAQRLDSACPGFATLLTRIAEAWEAAGRARRRAGRPPSPSTCARRPRPPRAWTSARRRSGPPSASWRDASTRPTAASARRPSSRPPAALAPPAATTGARATPRPWTWCGRPSTHGPAAASTTRSAAASTATPPTSAGWSPTSRRCSTTTPCSPRPISKASRPPRIRATRGSPARSSTTSCAR